MKKNLKSVKLSLIFFLVFFYSIIPLFLKSQDCSKLKASFTTYESRCASTGSIKIFTSGGSGSYKYKTLGPVNSNYTTIDSITGLAAGTYSVVITDIVTNCSITQQNIIVLGTYQDPRFALNSLDVSCDNGDNGNISVSGQQFGRPPFFYTIIAPSDMGVGLTNSTGLFTNLKAGNYMVRMTDSCGGIQTRQTKINNYTWQIDTYNFVKTVCDSATGFVKVVDSRGNISTVGSGILGFTYGIARQAGDTIWFADPYFQFDLAGYTNFDVVVKDNCGKVKKGNASITIKPTVGGVTISSKTCNSFTAAISGVSNFFKTSYCLYNSNNILINCNSSGIFSNLIYGNYCMDVFDSCSNITIRTCFGATPPPITISPDVVIADKICASFSATITGQTGLTNPSFCLYDSTNAILYCNSTGVFKYLSYGNYCITVQDGCRDTTIKKCIAVIREKPFIPDIITPIYTGNCATTFGINIVGTNLTKPAYCLYDSVHILLECNNTGIFNGLPFGRYCANVIDSCMDTTFIRCFTASPPVFLNDLVNVISNKACSTFNVKSASTILFNPNYCLYTITDSLIACNSTGIFNNINYGSYCVKAKSTCPDTTFKTCFTVQINMPSVDYTVQTSNKNCTDFSAQITGQTNLFNPTYCLFNAVNTQLACNNSGQFNHLAYGDYCIKVSSTCYDTTIVRCFTSVYEPVKLYVRSGPSCIYNYSKIYINVSNGTLPYNFQIFLPNGSLFFNQNFTVNNIVIDSIPQVAAGQVYKVIATDNCGAKDSANVSVTPSYVNHVAVSDGKCPSGTFVNGSGNINVTASTNMGYLAVSIIKMGNTILSPALNPNTITGGVYSFQNLNPATYIVKYNANDGCNKLLYDTVTVMPYQYPSLGRSSAYQCDVNGFALGAVITNGAGPFNYEIIGSNPDTPSIIAGPQQNPIFSINNGTNYSLVRLRAIDACGNGTLADASILPLANTGIVNTYNCFQIATTLSIDTVYGSTYAWYKKTNANSTDSIFLGNSSTYYIPEVMPADTGVYVCNLVVNNGCIARTYTYHLDGKCYHALPIMLQQFDGIFNGNKVYLNWNIPLYQTINKFIIERKNAMGAFVPIGEVNSAGSAENSNFGFIDKNPQNSNWYRLKILNLDNTLEYSNILNLNKKEILSNIQIYPNPADDFFTVNFEAMPLHTFKIYLLSTLGELIKELKFTNNSNNNLQIISVKNMIKGIYILKVADIINQKIITKKILIK